MALQVVFLFLFSLNAVAQNREFRVGLANAYTYQVSGNQISVPIEFPLDFGGLLINWQKQTSRFFPDQFVISNGTIQRSFLIIDKRPGSPLAGMIDKIVSGMSLKTANNYDFKKFRPDQFNQDEILLYLTINIQKHIDWIDNDGQQKSHLSAGPLAHLSTANYFIESERRNLLDDKVGSFIQTNYTHNSIFFEKIVTEKKGVCLDMVLLASFILERFQIPHKVVFGSVLSWDSFGNGHTWIELPDRRILDVAWNTLDYPVLHRHPNQKNWIWFGNSKGFQYRYAYDFFSILKL